MPYAIDHRAVVRRHAWSDLTAPERAALTRLQPHLDALLRDILDELYALFLTHDDLRAPFGDMSRVEEIKAKHRRHWLRLLSEPRGDALDAETVRMARAHYRSGIAPSWAMHTYRFVADRLVRRGVPLAQPGDHVELAAAIEKAIFQDLDVLVSTYTALDQAALREARDHYRTLLTDLLPASILARLDAGEPRIADRHECASVIFVDMAGFTEASARISPDALVALVVGAFTLMDRLGAARGLEKIKAMGDGCLIVSGVPEPRPDHADAAVRFAVDLQRCFAAPDTPWAELGLALRIGIHAGPLVAGLVGVRRAMYDVWGDTVNTASRLEKSCPPGRIQISDAVRRLLGPEHRTSSRGLVEIKGLGLREAHLIEPG